VPPHYVIALMYGDWVDGQMPDNVEGIAVFLTAGELDQG
jgi:hypothetical protein